MLAVRVALLNSMVDAFTVMVGEVNRGWYHAAATLDFERSSIATFAGTRRYLDDLLPLVRSRGMDDRDRHAMADLYTTVDDNKWHIDSLLGRSEETCKSCGLEYRTGKSECH